MNWRLATFSIVTLTLLCAGCASQTVRDYSRPSHASIFVSPGNVSTFTETPAQDYLIPDSQVFISGHGAFAARHFGLVGVGVGRSENASAVGAAAADLKLTFSDALAQAMSEQIAARSAPGQYEIVQQVATADLTLLPSAKLTVSEDNSAGLSFGLSVRYTDAASSSKSTKIYTYIHGGEKPISGANSWSDDKASALRDASKEALAQLSIVLLVDLAGGFGGAYDSDKQHFIRYSVVGGPGTLIRALVLREYDNHILVAPVFNDRPLRNYLLIYERRSIAISGT